MIGINRNDCSRSIGTADRDGPERAPSFVHISNGKLHDVHALDLLIPEAGAIYVMDRGYVDFARLYVLHQAGAFFVTRAKSNLDAHRVHSAPTDRATGIIADQTIALDGYSTSKDYPVHLRRVRFKDAASGKRLVFLTNHFTLPAALICDLYKSRWQVGVSSEGHAVMSVKVRPEPKDSGSEAREAPWRESKTAEPSDNILERSMREASGCNVQ